MAATAPSLMMAAIRPCHVRHSHFERWPVCDLPARAEANGYNITNIQIAGGWNDDGRDSQFYTILYSTVSNPGIIPPVDIGRQQPGDSALRCKRLDGGPDDVHARDRSGSRAMFMPLEVDFQYRKACRTGIPATVKSASSARPRPLRRLPDR